MPPLPRRRPVPADLFGGRLADCFLLDLAVVAAGDGPVAGMRSITFESPDLVGFEWRPGQDVMFEVPGAPGTRRRYTIRRADPVAGTLDIEVVLHGTGPFATWAAGAAAGDRIEGIGPRGVVTVREGAAHHLFVADASAIPVTFAMLESLPPTARASAVISVDEPPPSTGDVHWLTPPELTDHLASIELEPETAAYVNGERQLVRSATDLLVSRGLAPDAIASKPYWRRDEPNKPHGEPAKD